MGGVSVQTHVPVRHLNLHEYQSKDLMKKFNVRVQRGIMASTAEEAEQAAKDLLKQGIFFFHYCYYQI